jgi:hypothetical protein
MTRNNHNNSDTKTPQREVVESLQPSSIFYYKQSIS